MNLLACKAGKKPLLISGWPYHMKNGSKQHWILFFFSTVAWSAKWAQGMKTRFKPPPIFLLSPIGSRFSSHWFWASGAGPRYVSDWDPDLLLSSDRQLEKGDEQICVFIFVKNPIWFLMRVVLVSVLDLWNWPCRGRWAATVRLRPHGHFLFTAAQRVPLAYLPEQWGGCFFASCPSRYLGFISVLFIGSCFQWKLI